MSLSFPKKQKDKRKYVQEGEEKKEENDKRQKIMSTELKENDLTTNFIKEDQLNKEHSKFFFKITTKWIKKSNIIRLFKDENNIKYKVAKWITPTSFQIIVDQKENLLTTVEWDNEEMQWFLPLIKFNKSKNNYKVVEDKKTKLSFEWENWKYIENKTWKENKEVKLIPCNEKCKNYKLFLQDPKKYYESPKSKRKVVRLVQRNGLLLSEAGTSEIIRSKIFLCYGQRYFILNNYKVDPYDLFEGERERQSMEEIIQTENESVHDVFTIPGIVNIIGDYLSLV